MHPWSHKKANFSQGSQDFYLEKIFSVIQTTNKYFVEFGFNKPSYGSGGSGANTRKLYREGWSGLLLDAGHENPSINLKKHDLFASNIAAIFVENSVPKELDFLSCDMDSHDLWVFRAIMEAGYRPRVITTAHGKKITTKPQKTGVFERSPRCLIDGTRSVLNDRSVPRFPTPQKMKTAVACVNTAMHRMASNLGFQYRREIQSKPRSYMM